MELAMIGLGKMGFNMATRQAQGGHRVIGFARTAATAEAVEKNGVEGVHSLEVAVGNSKRRAPAGGHA